MARQSLVWTALPNGFTPDGSGLRVSAMLAPRLDPQSPAPGKLGSFFPDWENWPQTLASARFDVTYNGTTVSIPVTTTAGPDRVDTTLGAADSMVWKALFSAGTVVIGFVYRDLSSSKMLSYDTVAMAERIADLYRDLARAATDRMPRVTELIETERWRGFIGEVRSLDEHSVDPHTGLREPRWQFDALRRGSLEASDLLGNFQLFHTPPSGSTVTTAKRTDDKRIEARWREHKKGELPAPGKLADTMDFHKIVAAMGSYPTLLRRLGLVVDLVLAPGSLAAAAAADLTVQCVFPAGALQVPRTADGAPATRARLTASRFDAVPDPASDTPLVNGLLELAPARFRLLQVDVDGAGLKAMNFARSLRRRFNAESRVDPVTRHEDEAGAPALRTGGLTLVQRKRAGILSDRFKANKTRNATLESQLAGAGAAVKLHAQDLVRGYRIDIWDSVAARWHSLCRRTARYEVGAAPVVVDVAPEEESTVRLAATRSIDDATNKDILYLHEALVAWTGWSLAARPPGRAIGIEDDKVDKTRDDSDAQAPPGIPFKSSFAPVKGSLPRLRFGRSYWIRARAVDLAGNSLAPQADDFGIEQPALRAQPYLRYEPVAAPVTALLSRSGTIERPLEGESMGRIAIRSFNDTAADNVVPTSQLAHRVCAPPWVSVRDAEQHGKLDAGGKLDASLFDMLANQKDVDPRTPSAAIREETLLTQGPLEPQPTPTRFAVYESGRALTYLPDPLAVEVAVRVFDHPNIADSEIIRIPWYPTGAWPEAKPFTIEVYDDPLEAPYYDAAAHCLRVPLPKAVRARLRLSMTLSPESLAILGVFQWLEAGDQNAQRTRALSGQHWMLTPWTVLEAVHAVQRPLLDPGFVSLTINRGSRETCAFPVAHVVCSIDSTDRLDLFGEWHEPGDDPSVAGGPGDRHRRDVAFQVKVTGPRQYASTGVAPGTPDHDIAGTDVIVLNSGGHSRIVPKAHEFHDTRYRRIEYWFDATSRFREFLPGALLTTMTGGKRVPTDAHIKVTGARSVAWVPNSAPPPAPKILYVVPTFAWRREVDAQGTLSSWRRGGGLRVYLDRGWNASGYGEMLAVVLPSKGFADDPETAPSGAPYRKYVTLWGNDPVWSSAFVPGVAPALDHFPLARTAPDPTGAWLPPNAPAGEKDQRPGPFAVSSLSTSQVQERGGRVDVAPHDVFYDDARELWYCDIEIGAGAAYFPFVRLALARYQPTSIQGAHLSNVVLSDIIAVAPDRWVNVTPSPETRSAKVALYGAGYDESSGHQEASKAPSTVRLNPATGLVEMVAPAQVSERSVVEVWLERLDPQWGEDFGWQRVSDALVTTRSPAPATPPLVHLSGPSLGVKNALTAGISLWRTLWEGDVALPVDDGARYRVVIAEQEEYVVDDSRPYDKTPTRKGRRTVFVEKVEVW